jgi:hypothetical protein
VVKIGFDIFELFDADGGQAQDFRLAGGGQRIQPRVKLLRKALGAERACYRLNDQW